MPHIQQLDPHVADLIAAGEVVERPASVVKELMENAIDAGAGSVTVEIQHGGMTYIRVTDDGCGISPEEAPEAFLRHATSKLRTEYDLEAIGTLGFRGEALAAICAVSQVELLTRAEGEELGTCLTLEGGEVCSQEEAGCPKGTTILVRDLFYNTPARLKFMKKDAAEGAACFAAVQRTALSHPEVSIKFIRDGKQELLTPGDGLLQSALYAVLGRDMALGFTPVKGSGEEMSVSGFVSLPTCCRGTRGYQFFFVNGRHVKSRTMMAALEEAYANQKMVGKFPGCALHLVCKLNAVDVNVHPTKQEVKFGSERKVFEAVYYAVRAALEADHTRPSAEALPRRQEKHPGGVRGGFQNMRAGDFRQQAATGGGLPLHDFTAPRGAVAVPKGAGKTAAPAPRETLPSPAGPSGNAPEMRRGPERMWEAVPKAEREIPVERDTAEGVRELPSAMLEHEDRTARPVELGQGELEARSTVTGQDGPEVRPEAAGIQLETTEVRPEAAENSGVEALPQETALEEEELPGMPPPLPWRMAGEVLNTYIIVEQGEHILFIDKHAAHERLNFDRLKAEGFRPMVQALLAPVVVTPPPEEGAALLGQLELLGQFGFEAEDFGGGSLLVRAAPAGVEAGEIEAVLNELGSGLLSTGRADPEGARDALLHTMACKAAIKGGQKNSPEELLRVVQAVMDGTVKYCPHGRPVAIELTRGQLEKRFGRA